MARILITSGPTRQYLDPVRYLTNASSGRMGCELARAASQRGHDVVVVSGPVQVEYPDSVQLVEVTSTEQMLDACNQIFPDCHGLIAAAAPCDYRPRKIATEKIAKTGGPLQLQLIETPDVVATLGGQKQEGQWLVGFALETNDPRIRALVKLEKKSCDLMILNGPQAIDSETNRVEIIDRHGHLVGEADGTKNDVANKILTVIQARLIAPT
jgi:phosphopantothenoylcysteine decarboxylase/phosphopantothenate--cysteine ligase